jgi:hypothetical protein
MSEISEKYSLYELYIIINFLNIIKIIEPFRILNSIFIYQLIFFHTLYLIQM